MKASADPGDATTSFYSSSNLAVQASPSPVEEPAEDMLKQAQNPDEGSVSSQTPTSEEDPDEEQKKKASGFAKALHDWF